MPSDTNFLNGIKLRSIQHADDSFLDLYRELQFLNFYAYGQFAIYGESSV